MKDKFPVLFLGILLYCSVVSFQQNNYKYIFFLHNRFLEEHRLEDEHPEYGRTEYLEIINEFKANGFKVISEHRNGNGNAREYATGIVDQIDSLIKNGIESNKITVVGTSKGGYCPICFHYSKQSSLEFCVCCEFYGFRHSKHTRN